MEYRSGQWRPTYKDKQAGKQKFVVIEDVVSDECPVSLITPRSAELVKLYAEAELAGTSLPKILGDDPPAWAIDAQAICTAEDRRYEAERYKD